MIEELIHDNLNKFDTLTIEIQPLIIIRETKDPKHLQIFRDNQTAHLYLKEDQPLFQTILINFKINKIMRKKFSATTQSKIALASQNTSKLFLLLKLEVKSVRGRVLDILPPHGRVQ